MTQTIKSNKADRAYWTALSDLIPGWFLMGWTYQRSATYVTSNQWGGSNVISLTCRQRDDIVAAIRRTEEVS